MKSIYSIVGMKFRRAEAYVSALPKGSPLRLVREPNNSHDQNAIQVWSRDRHIGFVKAVEARELAVYIDASGAPPESGTGGRSLNVTFTVTPDRWPMVEIEENIDG